MLAPAKITLSPHELQLVTNSDWILTKRVIIDKVFRFFGDVCEEMKGIIGEEKAWLPATVINSEPKIYKGENYRQLPYVLMDYPRCFDTTNAFALRTMFWWGNFFSITLHLGGHYKKMFEQHLLNNEQAIRKGNYFICINDDQWQHHFEAENYLPVSSLTKENVRDIINNRQFIKLSLQYSLQQWDEMPDLLERSFYEMLQLLKN